MSGYRVTWTSHTGTVLELSMDARSDSGIWLKSLSGFVASPSVATVKRTTGRGEIPTALTVPKMTGSMKLHIDPGLAEVPTTVSELWSHLTGQFSTVLPGEMTIHIPDGTSMTSPFYLTSPIGFPGGRSPHTPGIREIDMDVELWSPDGGWDGAVRYGTDPVDGVRTFYNPGDLEAYIQLEILPGGDPASRAYTFAPSGSIGHMVTLPTVAGVRYIDTNTGTGFAILDAAGNRDRSAQVAMRGRYIPGRIPPGGYAHVTTGANVVPSLIPYYLSPWR